MFEGVQDILTLLQLLNYCCSDKAVKISFQTNGNGCVPIKLYLEKTGWWWAGFGPSTVLC